MEPNQERETNGLEKPKTSAGNGRLLRGLAMKLVLAFNNWVLIPIARWAGKDLATFATPGRDEDPYIPAVAYINTFVLKAAMDDREREKEQNPEQFQAILNACLESVHSPLVSSSILMFMADLIASGYEPIEAAHRVMANVLHLGMHLERRLSSVSPAPPCNRVPITNGWAEADLFEEGSRCTD